MLSEGRASKASGEGVLSLFSRCTALLSSHRAWHGNGKGKQGNRWHNDSDGRDNDSKGRHGDGKRQQGDRRHGNGDRQHDDGNGRHDGGKGQQGVRWQDDGDGRHDDRTT